MANRPLGEEIARIAARQHGVITRRQLLAIGLGRGGVDARLERGLLHALHAGVYLVGHTAELPRAREMAAVLACGAGTAISHRSAAPFWNLAHEFDCADVEVTVTGARAPQRARIRAYRTAALTADEVRIVDGIPVTSPARTIVDVSRFLTTAALEHVVADAIRRGVVLQIQLTRALERHRGRRGVATLRSVMSGVEPAFTRSAAERRLLRVIRDVSLPSPVLNARVGGHEVDFLWPAQRVIVEVDGFQWHSDRAAFERDRLRDAELQALGYRVIRVTWRQLQREPRAVIARIAATLRRGADLPAHR
jgi:very-short-patch-repair endonuclease